MEKENSGGIRLDFSGSCVILNVKAHPGAKRNRVGGAHDGALRVEVTAPPEKGKANKAIVELLAEALGAARGNVEIVGGETSGRKRVKICGLERARLEARLAELLKGRG